MTETKRELSFLDRLYVVGVFGAIALLGGVTGGLTAAVGLHIARPNDCQAQVVHHWSTTDDGGHRTPMASPPVYRHVVLGGGPAHIDPGATEGS